MILVFMLMMVLKPWVTTALSSLIFFLLGKWAGHSPTAIRWYTPLLVNLWLWVVFIPMGMDVWHLKIHIYYFLLPPLFALPATYLGLYTSKTRQSLR